MKNEEHSLTPWVTVEKKLHANCKVFNVYKKTCTHSTLNAKSDFFVIDSPNWVKSVALTPDNHLVMVRQYRFGIEDFSLEIPGGVQDPNEDPIQTATRELQEETGFTGPNPKLIAQCKPNPAILNNTVSFVLIENATQSQSTNWDAHEELQTILIPLDQAFEQVLNGEIQHAITLLALLQLKLYLNL